MSITAIVYTDEEARVLLDAGEPFDRAVAMTPPAMSMLSEFRDRIDLSEPRDHFDDDAYANAMRAYESTAARLDRRIESEKALSNASRMLAHYGLRSIWTSALRLASCLGQGPWIIPARDGSIQRTDDRHLAQCRVFEVLFGYWRINWIGHHPYVPPPLPGLFRLIRDFTILAAPKVKQPVHVTRSTHPYKFDQELKKRGAVFVHATPCYRGWREYAVVLRDFYRRWRGADALQVRTICNPNNLAGSRIRNIFREIDAPEIAAALDVVLDDLVEKVAFIEGLATDTDRVLGLDKAKQFFSYEIADGLTASLADRVRTRGGRTIIVNHNTHSDTNDPVGRLAVDEMARTMCPPYLTDYAFMWTPTSVTTTRRALGNTTGNRVGPAPRPATVDPSERFSESSDEQIEFNILYASNFHRWMHCFPWVFEFSDEFFDTFKSVLRACHSVEGTALVSRIKFRDEVKREFVAEALEGLSRSSFKGRSELPFREDLKRADLLISFSSTTIYEALMARIPVILFSSTNRYDRLPGSTHPPTSKDRSAVYIAKDETALVTMIPAILKSHAGRPLSDDEVRQHVYLTKDIADQAVLADAILSEPDDLAEYCRQTAAGTLRVAAE